MTTRLDANNITAGSITSDRIAANAITLDKLPTGIFGPRITTVVLPGSQTAVGPTGGETVVITGTGFSLAVQVYFGSALCPSITRVSSTQLSVVTPVLGTGTYTLYVVNSNGGTAVRLSGITVSAIPIWSTGSTLPTISAGTTINIQLASPSDSTVTYTVDSGSILPTGLTLSSSGLLSGNIVDIVSDTIYNFTIAATDAEAQINTKTFSITVTPVTATVPGIPTIGTAVANGTATAAVSYTVPSTNGGSNIIGYTAVSSPGGVTGTVSQSGSGTITVTGLSSSTSYTFTVYATNNLGNSDSSNSSNSITTWALPGAPTIGAVTINQTTATIPFTAPASNGGTAITSYTAVSSPGGITSTLSQAGSGSIAVLALVPELAYTFTVYATNSVGNSSSSGSSNSILAYAADSNFSSVPLLLKTSPGIAAIITDSSANSLNITRNGAPRTALTSPYQTDGYWSNYFAANGDFISVPDAATLELGASDFQISAWIYLTAYPASNLGAYFSIIISKGIYSNSRSYQFGVGGASGTTLGLNLISGSTETNINGSFSFALNTWYEVRASRVSNSVYIFVNGTLLNAGGTPYTDTINDSADILRVGRGNLDVNYVYQFFGYISNVSVAIGGTGYSTSNYTPATTPTVSTADTRFLSCQSNRFKDNSSNNATITLAGTPQITSSFYPSGFTAPAASPGAILLNGTTDFLAAPGNFLFAFGTGDFTVEGWFFTTVSANQGLWDNRLSTTSTTGFAANLVVTTNTLRVVFNNAALFTTTQAVLLNQWNHIAVVRSSSTVTAYLNGAAMTGGSATASTPSITDTNMWVGKLQDAGFFYNGFISNFRVVKGTAVYTGAFAPPRNFVTLTGGTYTSTTNVNTGIPSVNTSLLLNFANSTYTDSSDKVQNSLFIDSSTNNFIIARVGSPTQGSFAPYRTAGYWSVNFSSSYLSVADSAGLRFGAANFTIEAWVFRIASGVIHTIACKGSSSGPTGWVLQINAADKLVFIDTTTSIAGLTSIAVNTWTYVAVVRAGPGLTSLYINGAFDGTGTSATTFSQTDAMRIGTDRSATNNFAGYISNLRLSNTNLTISRQTAPLTVTGSTIFYSLAYHRFVDGSSLNSTITISAGSPQVQAFQPFSLPLPYYTVYGGSGYFNGTTDYLSITNNTALQLGTGNFTIEGWFYFLGALSTAYNLISKGAASTGWSLNTTTGARIQFSYTAANLTGVTTPLVANNWYHFAVVRSGSSTGNLRIYINGVQEIASPGAVNDDFSQTDLMYISASRTATVPLNGYSSNVRIVKGVAVYTGAFAPPILAPLTVAGSTSAASYSSTTNINTSFASSSTSLLLGMNNIGIYDATSQNNLVTVGDSQASITQKQWGFTSARFDGAGDWLTAVDGPQLQLLTGDFTIDGWVYSTVNFVAYGIISKGTATTGWSVNVTSGNRLQFSYTATSVLGNVPLSANVWQYFAVVRSGSNSGNLKLYVNGVLDATSSPAVNDNFNQTNLLYVGADRVGGSVLNGFLQDIRITKGLARSINFPTAALGTV